VSALAGGLSRRVRQVAFGPVRIGFDATVLEPRHWTIAQSRIAVDLLRDEPPGAVLELCTGAGHIGLATAAWTGRPLVQVDDSADACRWARHNAAANGLAVDVRHAPMEEALDDGEQFALVLADPPYVPTRQVTRYPDDPRHAIDGGADGLDVVRACLAVITRHAGASAPVVLQVRGPAQADRVAALVQQDGLPFAAERAHVVSPERAVLVLRVGDVRGDS
jgi:methylase of polypeptide subunit release factors